VVSVDRARNFFHGGDQPSQPFIYFVLATGYLVYVNTQGLAALHDPRFEAVRISGVCLELSVHHLLQLSNHAVGFLYVCLYSGDIHSIVEHGILRQREL
jgi:hypothetical protein